MKFGKTHYPIKIFWFICMRWLWILGLTRICLHEAAYFSFRVFLSCVVHYQYGVSVVSLPGHLHLFHTDWGWLWSVLVSVVQFAFNTLCLGAKKQEVQKAQSHFSAIYVFSITHHLFFREGTNSSSVCTDNPWVGWERPCQSDFPLVASLKRV